MPTKRFENMNTERKKKILDTARAEFTRNGYEVASLNTIVREAGISKGSLYYYFEDKTDLYLTVLGNFMEEVNRKIGGVGIGEFTDDFWSDVENYINSMIKIAREYPDLVQLFRGLYYLSVSRSRPELIAEFYNNGKAITADIVKRGQEEGAVRKDIPLDLLVNIIFSLGEAMDFWLLERWDKFEPEEIEEMPSLYMELFRRIAGVDLVNCGGE